MADPNYTPPTPAERIAVLMLRREANLKLIYSLLGIVLVAWSAAFVGAAWWGTARGSGLPWLLLLVAIGVVAFGVVVHLGRRNHDIKTEIATLAAEAWPEKR
jgi:hypothetical protein